MLNFPLLSRGPSFTDEFTDDLVQDPTLKSPYADGHVLTRASCTLTKKRFVRMFRYLQQSEKELLESFQKQVNVGGESFNWVDVPTNDTYEVRLAEKISFRREPEKFSLWQAKVILEEV